MDDYFDDTVVNDRLLPDVAMDVVEEYADRTYLMLNKNTDGDRTKITNVDVLYELMGDKDVVNYCVKIINESSHYNNNYNVMYANKNELCYKYIRLLYDDGG